MVSKKKLTLYGLDDIIAYFELLLNAERDGKIKQARALWKQMSAKQKIGFYNWYSQNHKSLNHAFGLGTTVTEVDEYLGSLTPLRKFGRKKATKMTHVKIGDLTVYEFISLIKETIAHKN